MTQAQADTARAPVIKEPIAMSTQKAMATQLKVANQASRTHKLVPDSVVKAEKLHPSANRSYQVKGQRYQPLNKVSQFSQEGRASWYGKQFHGRKTSSGERYDMHEMTAAHKTLPIPSYAKVTNVSNGKSVIVRINDRGPFHGNRVIDVSYGAAQKLGMVNTGTAKVRVEQLVPGQLAQAQTPSNTYVNLHTFDQVSDAQAYLKRVSDLVKQGDHEQKVIMVRQNDQYVVRIGPFANKEKAESLKKNMLTAL